LLLVIWGCVGQAPPPGDQETEPVATPEPGEEVFEDGFEEGDTKEWDQGAEAGQEEVQADEEPSPTSSEPSQ